MRKNASIWFSAVVRGDIETIEIGEGSNVQDCAVVHTDFDKPTFIGKNVSIGHSAIIHGATIFLTANCQVQKERAETLAGTSPCEITFHKKYTTNL